MTEQLKLIVQELSKPPFSKPFNLISFDSLEPLQLLQVLSDVFTTVQGNAAVDIRGEAAEDTAFRLLTALRLLKYPAPTDPEEQSVFRQGLVEGDKHVVYPILIWIFPRVAEIQKRLYLAKYLVRTDVPAEFMQDIEVEQLFQKVEALMEDFKDTHKLSETFQADGATSEDIRNDIRSMETERDQVMKRIDKVKKKVEHAPQREKMMEMARRLRMESDREFHLSHQKQEQRNALLHAEQKVQRLSQQLKELNDNMQHHNPEDVVKRLEEETQTQQYLVSEKLPKEISVKRKTVHELQKVLSTPALDEKDIEGIKSKIEEVNNQINTLVEERDVKSDPTEDKVAVYRQQAAMVGRKKEAIAEKLQQLRSEKEEAEEELRIKKQQYRDEDGNEIITQTQFKAYLAQLRSKTAEYKKKRHEINDLKAEVGVLTRTCEILESQAGDLRAVVDPSDSNLEDDRPAVVGQAESLQGKSPGDILDMAKALKDRVADKRNIANGLMNELKPLRAQIEQSTENLDAAKRQYNNTVGNLESNYAHFEETVKRLSEEINSAKSQMYKLEVEKRILDAKISRAQNEGSGANQNSFKAQLTNKIQQAETVSKTLREEQKSLGEKQQIGGKQLQMWRDLAKIMEHKKMAFERAQRIKEARSPNQRYPDHVGSATGSRRGSSSRGGSAFNR